MNPLRRVWNWILWWPLRGLMSRPSCRTADRWEQLTGKTARCGDDCLRCDSRGAALRGGGEHPYRHPDPHSHAGVDSCFICEEHAEATGCVLQEVRVSLTLWELLELMDPDTWDFGALE